MSTQHDRTLCGCDSYAKQLSLRYPRDCCLITFVERQQVLELETISGPFVVLVFGVVQAEYACMTNRRSDYEDT